MVEPFSRVRTPIHLDPRCTLVRTTLSGSYFDPPGEPALTPREKAAVLRESLFEGSEFAELTLREIDVWFHLVYEAESGDSIRSVMARYREFAPAGMGNFDEMVAQSRALHRSAYDRGLWAGDEILLPLPEPIEEPGEGGTPDQTIRSRTQTET